MPSGIDRDPVAMVKSLHAVDCICAHEQAPPTPGRTADRDDRARRNVMARIGGATPGNVSSLRMNRSLTAGGPVHRHPGLSRINWPLIELDDALYIWSTIAASWVGHDHRGPQPADAVIARRRRCGRVEGWPVGRRQQQRRRLTNARRDRDPPLRPADNQRARADLSAQADRPGIKASGFVARSCA